MRSWVRHPLRVTVRLIWFGGELLLGVGDYLARGLLRSSASNPSARAEWLHHRSRRALKVFHVEVAFAGPLPTSGLLVCNHLSYIDIPVIASQAPCVFVAKSEVRGWPVFGWFARLAGTVFVQRTKRTDAGRAMGEIKAALAAGHLVVLFPEGTSSGGETVLPFKSALLEPAAQSGRAVMAAHIHYELADGEGDASEEVCYWKDMTLLPHMINLLGKRSIRARVRFTSGPAGNPDRKELARQLHAEVLRLKTLTVF
jgi:1-acyl-sn-glycerol-3-phosphate acyltransferase